jgi:hypothetical protein
MYIAVENKVGKRHGSHGSMPRVSTTARDAAGIYEFVPYGVTSGFEAEEQLRAVATRPVYRRRHIYTDTMRTSGARAHSDRYLYYIRSENMWAVSSAVGVAPFDIACPGSAYSPNAAAAIAVATAAQSAKTRRAQADPDQGQTDPDQGTRGTVGWMSRLRAGTEYGVAFKFDPHVSVACTTLMPTPAPSITPTPAPSISPTVLPAPKHTGVPSRCPSAAPTNAPSTAPTELRATVSASISTAALTIGREGAAAARKGTGKAELKGRKEAEGNRQAQTGERHAVQMHRPALFALGGVVVLLFGLSAGGVQTMTIHFGLRATALQTPGGSSNTPQGPDYAHTRRQYQPEPEQLAFFKHGRGEARSYSRVEKTEEELLPGADRASASAGWYADGTDGEGKGPRVDDLI